MMLIIADAPYASLRLFTLIAAIILFSPFSCHYFDFSSIYADDAITPLWLMPFRCRHTPLRLSLMPLLIDTPMPLLPIDISSLFLRCDLRHYAITY